MLERGFIPVGPAIRRAAALSALLAGTWVANAQEPVKTAPDAAARFFATRCTGCHTIGRGTLTGPDLTTSIAWPEADLEKAVLRMQEKAGAFTRDELAAIMALLKDPAVKERVAAEEARIAQQFAVKLAPPNAATGERLFQGSELFENGGMACNACHALGDRTGGTLGPDLSGIFGRMGEAGLLSALEKAPFKVMAPTYRDKALTRQEIVHLTRWLQSVDSIAPLERRDPLAPVAASIAVLFLGALVAGTRKSQRAHGRRSLERRTRS